MCVGGVGLGGGSNLQPDGQRKRMRLEMNNRRMLVITFGSGYCHLEVTFDFFGQSDLVCK